MEHTIARMREGIKARIILPKVVLERVPAQIDHQIVSDPKASPFYKPFSKFSASVSLADSSRLAREAQGVVASAVIPAFRQLKQFFTNDYLPASLNQVGVWQLPDGEARYSFSVRLYTTTDMTPKEIHEIGLSEVKRIRAEMQAIIDKLGFQGTLADFFTFFENRPAILLQVTGGTA